MKRLTTAALVTLALNACSPERTAVEDSSSVISDDVPVSAGQEFTPPDAILVTPKEDEVRGRSHELQDCIDMIAEFAFERDGRLRQNLPRSTSLLPTYKEFIQAGTEGAYGMLAIHPPRVVRRGLPNPRISQERFISYLEQDERFALCLDPSGDFYADLTASLMDHRNSGWGYSLGPTSRFDVFFPLAVELAAQHDIDLEPSARKLLDDMLDAFNDRVARNGSLGDMEQYANNCEGRVSAILRLADFLGEDTEQLRSDLAQQAVEYALDFAESGDLYSSRYTNIVHPWYGLEVPGDVLRFAERLGADVSREYGMVAEIMEQRRDEFLDRVGPDAVDATDRPAIDAFEDEIGYLRDRSFFSRNELVGEAIGRPEPPEPVCAPELDYLE